MHSMIKLPSRLFLSDAEERQYRKEGFLIVSLFDDTTVQHLQEAFRAYVHEQLPDILYTSHNRNSLETNQAISHAIETAILPSLERKLHGFRPVLGHFISKSAGNNYEFALHQDWNITEEKSFAVAHIWIPLQDTYKENGGMFVVPRSHRFFDNMRSGSLGIPRISRQEGFEEVLLPLTIKRGQALIYHPALFHGSYPNKSHQDREVALMSLVEDCAPLLYFHLNKKQRKIISYQIEAETVLTQLPVLEKGYPPVNCPIERTMAAPALVNNHIALADLKRKRDRFNYWQLLHFLKDRMV
jgi:hypothetical protein